MRTHSSTHAPVASLFTLLAGLASIQHGCSSSSSGSPSDAAGSVAGANADAGADQANPTGSGGAAGSGGHLGSGGAVGAGGQVGSGGSSGAGGGTAGVLCIDPTATGTCTKAEVDALATCVFNACDSETKVCEGPGYRTGQFGGPCAQTSKCLSDCGCDNQPCRKNCNDMEPSACTTCKSTLDVCLSRALLPGGACPIPLCALNQPDGGVVIPPSDGGVIIPPVDAAGGTCADLQKCCPTLPTLANSKAACEQVAAAGMEALCSQFLGVVRQAGLCK